MKTFEQNENRRLNIFIQICGLLSASLGFLAILGWILNIPQLASFDSSKIPMAISTAVLFVAFGFIIFFYKRIISNRIMFRVGVVISIIGIIIALLLLYLALKGIHPRAGHLGLGISFAVDGLIVGQMSPVTAFCFVFVGLSFLIMLLKPGQKKLIKASLIFAVLVFFISIILLLSYLLGTPLLYEESFIPPALTTSLAFLFLGIALLLISGLKVWTYGELSDALSTRYTYSLALVFVILIISVMTTGYSYYKNYEKQYRFGTEQDLSTIATLKVNQIVQWRKERLGDAKVIYKNAEFSGLVHRLLKNKNDIDVKKRIQEWIDIVTSTYQYESISLHDLKGRELVTSPIRKIHSHIFFSKLLSEIRKSGEIKFKDFYRDENDLRIYLAIFIPIQFDNNLIGILDLRLDPQQYLYPLINEWPILSKTAETLIVRREGNEVVFLNDLRFQKNTALNLRRPLTKLNLPAVRAALGKKEFIESVDHRGIPVIAYVRPIPDSPWFLVARIDKSEVYAPLREWFWAIIILVVGLLIGSGASVGFVWRNQQSKFHKERFETGKTLQHLSTRYEAILASVPEIIMEVDNNKIYTWSNAAGLEFFGNDVIGKDALYYFEGEQETYQSVKQLFDGSKEIVYVESWQRRKDGKKRLLAWWCKVLKDEKGVVTGALSSAQDITERKRADDALIESEKKFRTVVEEAVEIVFTLDNRGYFTYVNTAGLRSSGYSLDELKKLKYIDLIEPKFKQKVKRNYFKQYLERSSSSTTEYPFRTKCGEIKWFNQNARLIIENDEVKGFYVIARDVTERRIAEEALKESEERFRSLYENSTIGLYRTTPDGKIILTNPTLVKMLGYSSFEELAAKNLVKEGFEPSNERNLFLNKIELNGEVKGFESAWTTKDGSVVYISESARANRDSNGKTLYYDGTVEDITNRKRAEETLMTLSSAIEQTADTVVITDREGIIEYVNPSFEELTGYSSEETVGKTPRILKSGTRDQKYYEAMWNTILSGNVFRAEIVNKKKNGDLYYEEKTISPIFDKNKNLTHFVGTGVDITERKLADKKITMLALSLKSINECVSITDIEDNIIFVNDAFLKTYGYDENELIGKNMNIVRSLNNPPELVKEILPATLSGGWKGELWNKRKDGSEFVIYLSTTLIKDKDGNSIGLIGVAKDITERKHAEKELIEAKEKAEQSDKLKTEFLAQMSHEIRTPINIMLGNVDYLQGLFDEKMDADARDCFEGIDLASKRIIRTVDLVLNTSELQTSGYKPALQKVNLDSEILRKVYNEHQLSANQKGLELIYKNDIKKSEIMADEYSITQIFANLVDNAIKFTKKGKVEIHLLENKTGNIIVEIKDTGIGMNKEFISRMFEPFVQEEPGYSRSYDGNGLGLALVKNYCEINNATLEVESEKNVGSTFRVIFKD